MRNLSTIFVGAAMAALMCGSVQAAPNLVQNPGFETGDLTGWVTNSGSPWGTGDGLSMVDVHSGTYSADTGCGNTACLDPSTGAYLYQDLSTVAGDTYNLTFWFGAASGTPTQDNSPDELRVFWAGTQELDLVGGTSIVTNDGAGGETEYTVDGLTASSALTRLEFTGYDSPGYLHLDDVSVTLAATGGVPEPAAWATMLLGLGAAGGALRVAREKKRVATAAS